MIMMVVNQIENKKNSEWKEREQKKNERYRPYEKIDIFRFFLFSFFWGLKVMFRTSG
jgi:hypothetical protein